jgi:geranylgeranyl reductase family protein
MNSPIIAASLPTQCDVLVVGAGPAGSACGQWLARAGFDTLMVDQFDFPRDKTCGDALIPDAIRALERLGVLDEVMSLAQSVSHVRCVGPTGRYADVTGTLAVLPRRQLDLVLVQAAQRAGAHLATPWHFDGLLKDQSGRVTGGRFQRAGEMREVHARQVVLATGAAPQALVASGLCERRAPSAMGLRGYVKNDQMAGRITHLEVVWHPRLKPGYGWIFPCRDGVFNIGVGIDCHKPNGNRMPDVNMREVFDKFTQVHAPARELMAGGTLQGSLKGAPLRHSLKGTVFAAPGILVTGEAAGSTYGFTGEGIGKAMETGLLAAEAVMAGRTEGLDDAAICAHYTDAMNRLKPRFDFYEKGNLVNHYPWLAELCVRRAANSPVMRQRMNNLLEERFTPGAGITLRRVFKWLTK